MIQSLIKINSYDIVSNPGFGSAKMIFSDHNIKIKCEILLKEILRNTKIDSILK